MNRDNSIDPEVLYSMLQKYFNGGVHKYVLGGEEGFDPYGNPITTNSQFAQGAFDNQLPVQNPFAQPSNQIQLGGSNFGTPQNTKPLVYDWQNNPSGYDQLLNSINQKPDWSKSETEYWKENPSVAGMNAPDLQNPIGGNSYTEIFDNQDGAGNQNPNVTNASVGGNPPNGWTDEQLQEYEKRQAALVNQAKGKDKPPAGETLSDEDKDKRNYEYMRLMNAGMGVGGMGMEGALFNLGKGLGADTGTKGKGALIATSALSSLFKGARNVASGMGVANVNREFEDWQRKQLLKRDYPSDRQEDDNNYTGGYKYGGEFDGRLNTFEKGGPMESAPPEKRETPYGITNDESFIKYATLTPEEKARAMQSYEEFTGRSVNNDTFDITENQLRDFRSGEPVKGYWGEGKTPYVEQKAHFIITERGAIPKWVSRNEYENFKGGKTTASLDASGYPLVGASGGSRIDPNKYQDMRDNQLGSFSTGTPQQLNTLDLKGKVFRDGGTSYDKLRQYFENGGQSMQQQGQPMQEQQAPDGTENYEIGQDVEFEYNGKMVSGKIKKIENGQIYI